MNHSDWMTICHIEDLIKDSGVCALVEGEQIAIFFLTKHPQQLFAIGNYDPIGKANVMYRGIVGSIDGEPVVASPLYKQRFSLLSGQCLEEGEVKLKVYPIRVSGDNIQLNVA